jgi:hypothetical protein
LQGKKIEEEDNTIVIFFITKIKSKNIFSKRGEGKSLPFATALKLLSSSCIAAKLLLPCS